MNHQLELNASDIVRNSTIVKIKLTKVKKFQRRVSFGLLFVKLGFFIIGLPIEIDMGYLE